jgi:hypothetical protein
MPLINTTLSYLLRSLIILHLFCLWLLFKTRHAFNPSSASRYGLVLEIAAVLICGVLLADLFSRKDPSRRFAKLIDSVMGIGWLIAIAELIVYSLGLGTT